MNECNPIQGFLQICRLGLPCWQQRRRLQRTPSLSPVPPGWQWRWWAHWDRWNIPTINQSSSQSHINDELKIEQEKAMTHRLPCLSMTSRRSKGRIEARNKVFTGIRFYYLCLYPCLIWASTVTNSIKVVHFIEVLRLVTDRWFSLLGPKESLMSRCRWMARWGILSRGLETWTSRFTSFPPLWSKKYGVSITSKGHYTN